MAKLTIAKINEGARNECIKELTENGVKNFYQIEGTKYAKDFNYTLEGQDFTKTVRVDIVVPKLEEGENAETLGNDFQIRMEEKRQKEEERKIAKEKKIARDKKRREEKGE